jgi:hypothetical protein
MLTQEYAQTVFIMYMSIVQVPALKPWMECKKYKVGGGNDTQWPADWL